MQANQIETTTHIAAREVLVVHAQQTDKACRQAATGGECSKSHGAAQKMAPAGHGQPTHQVPSEHLQLHSTLVARMSRRPRAGRQRITHSPERGLALRSAGKEPVQQTVQPVCPVGNTVRAAQPAPQCKDLFQVAAQTTDRAGFGGVSHPPGRDAAEQNITVRECLPQHQPVAAVAPGMVGTQG